MLIKLLPWRITYFLYYVISSVMGDNSEISEKISSCYFPPISRNSQVKIVEVSNIKKEYTIIYLCDDKFYLLGNKTMTCIDGVYSSNPPYCVINIAIHKPSEQLSRVYSCESWKANDGSADTFTVIEKQKNSWWSMVLFRTYKIEAIKIKYSKSSPNFKIVVTNENTEITDFDSTSQCISDQVKIDKLPNSVLVKEIICRPPLSGKYLKIVVNSEVVFHLHEVEVLTSDKKEFPSYRCFKNKEVDIDAIHFNGHCYSLFNDFSDWETAKIKCENKDGKLLDKNDQHLWLLMYWEIYHKQSNKEKAQNDFWIEENQACKVWTFNKTNLNKTKMIRCREKLPFICEYDPKSCGSPDVTGNSRIINPKRIYYIGTTVSYVCQRTFKLVGQPFRTCEISGSWSGLAPICKNILHCPNPPVLSNGVSKLISKTKAKYYCYKGYEMIGNYEIKCTEKGWSTSIPRCKKIFHCASLPILPNGGAKLLSKTRAMYYCNEGYKMIGNCEIRCTKNGWDTNIPKCKKILHCSNPPKLSNGVSKLISKTKVKYYCNKGYEMIGNSEINCTKNGWNTNMPRCKELNCGIPPAREHIQICLITGTTIVGSLVKYSCHSGYKLIGMNFGKCSENGHWIIPRFICQKI